jgi:hypothetical protein
MSDDFLTVITSTAMGRERLKQLQDQGKDTMSDIQPTERELKLVNHIDGGLGDHCENHGKVKVCNCQSVKNWLLSLVMLHTRYNGLTAEQWKQQCEVELDEAKFQKQRAEAAEAKVNEYERTEPLKIAECQRLRQRIAELEASRDAAIAGTAEATAILMQGKVAEAVSQRTVECADVAGYEFTKHDHTGYSVCNAILALNTPAQAYPFGLDASGKKCQCWTMHHNGPAWQDNEGSVWSLGGKIRHCPFCGAPRTKGI